MTGKSHWQLSRAHFFAFYETGDWGPDERSSYNRSGGSKIFVLPSKSPVEALGVVYRCSGLRLD
nr:unnamed protein product [Callosobruchus analis]